MDKIQENLLVPIKKVKKIIKKLEKSGKLSGNYIEKKHYQVTSGLEAFIDKLDQPIKEWKRKFQLKRHDKGETA